MGHGVRKEKEEKGDHYNDIMLYLKPRNTSMNLKLLAKQRTLQILGIFNFLWRLLVTGVCSGVAVEAKKDKMLGSRS